MKKVAVVMLMLIVASSVLALDTKSRSQGTKAGLEQTVKVFFDAVKANDTAKIKGYYTPDYTFTGPDGKLMNADDRLKMMSSGGANTFLKYADLSVRTYGGTGVVTGIATTMNKSSCATEQGRFIQTWTWQKGRWWLAASQVTSISQ